MNLNLSKSELNLLLSQLQQRLSELNTNGDDQRNPVDSSNRTTQKSFKNQPKSTSMFNLDLIDNSATINRRTSKSHVFPDQPRVANGKSLGNLIQEESDLCDQIEAFRHSASTSHSSWNTQFDAVSPNNSAHSANSQPRSYRRFVHNANPDFSVESFLNKKQQALEYRGQLDLQVKEKKQKLQQQLMFEKIKEAMLEQKIKEQQKCLKKEFDADHKFDKNCSDSKFIIDSNVNNDKTESLTSAMTNKISNEKSHIFQTTNQKATLNESKQSNGQTKSVRPEKKTIISTHTNGKQNKETANANTSTYPYPDGNHTNVCTQTDDSLLFDLIHDFMAKESMHRNMVASSVKRTPKMTVKPSPQPKNTVRTSLTRHSNSKPSVTRKK